MYITSLCGLTAWFALARGNRPIFLAMLLLILGIGPFRVVDGAHWPSDVLAGYALALAWRRCPRSIGRPVERDVLVFEDALQDEGLLK